MAVFAILQLLVAIAVGGWLVYRLVELDGKPGELWFILLVTYFIFLDIAIFN